jgi:hypothetical protein
MKKILNEGNRMHNFVQCVCENILLRFRNRDKLRFRFRLFDKLRLRFRFHNTGFYTGLFNHNFVMGELNLKFRIRIFLFKNCNLLIPRPPLRTSNYLRSLQASKEDMKLLNFFLFLRVIFVLDWICIRNTATNTSWY